MTKICKIGESNIGCGRELDISLFHTNRGVKQSYCKSCMTVYQRVRKLTKPSKAQIAREHCNKLIREKQSV